MNKKEKLKQQVALAYLKGNQNGSMSQYINGTKKKSGSRLAGSRKKGRVRGMKK